MALRVAASRFQGDTGHLGSGRGSWPFAQGLFCSCPYRATAGAVGFPASLGMKGRLECCVVSL